MEKGRYKRSLGEVRESCGLVRWHLVNEGGERTHAININIALLRDGMIFGIVMEQ